MVLFIKFLILSILNYVVILTSPYIDTFQIVEDLSFFWTIELDYIFITYLIVSFSVSTLTIALINIFKPFIEIYLLHYSRFLFYFLVSLLGLSTVYIVLRVYGYSRLSLLVYLLSSSLILNYTSTFVRMLRSKN
jgi:hypothetical protein